MEYLDDSMSLVVSAGVQAGIPVTVSEAEPVKYACCAKILALG